MAGFTPRSSGLTSAHRRRGLAVLLIAAAACSESTAAPVWEITGTTNHIVLLGSMHYLRAADYPLAAEVARAYAGADVLLMELDLDDLDQAQTQALVAERAIDPGGRTLRDLLGGADYQRARERAARLEIELDDLQAFEPWYVAVLITQIRLGQLGFDPLMGMESRLLADAQRDAKPILGLETVGEQLAALDTLPHEAQRAFLLTTLDEAAAIDSELDSLVTAWKSGDTERLQTQMLGSLQAQPELYEQLIVARNRRFADRIAALRNDGRDYLVVVGTLHLVGADGIPALLASAGIASRRLPVP